MPFQNTRRKLFPLTNKTAALGETVTWDLPKTGLLAGIWIEINGTFAGVSQPNAAGQAHVVRSARLYLNSGHDVFNLSGPGYHYILRDFLEHNIDVVPHTTARSAIANGAFDVSMFVPIALNSRDPVGLLNLQSEEMLATLQVELASSIGNAGTANSTNIKPWLELFTVPVRDQDMPSLSVLHQILEERQVLTATSGDHDYRWPRGNTYVQLLHGYGIAQSPADDWTRARWILNQSETLIDLDPDGADLEYNRFHGRDRLLGVIPFDFFGASGLGNYGSARDFFDSALVTDCVTRITLGAADTLYTIRRQLVDLGEE